MGFIFVGQFWHRDPIYPILRLVPSRGVKHSEYPLTLGEQFNIKISPERYCIGTSHFDKGWITCIENQNEYNRQNLVEGVQEAKKVGSSLNQCLLCQEDDFYRCRKICSGEICEPSSQAAFNKCQPPDTAVYLTHIAGELKVGVSLRKEGRWLDQGSDYSTVVAYAPGLEARRIEQRLGQKLDLKLHIKNSTKFRNFSPMPMEYVAEEIEDTVTKAQQIIDEVLKGCEGKRIKNPKIYDYTSYYGKIDFERPIQVVDIKDEADIEFGGSIVALKGSLLVVQQGIYYWGIDTKELISREFEFLNRDAKMEGQTSLDEWFNR